ncbi:MAG: hypothetical protein K1W33_05360 [Clostridia bacterium]
MSFFDDVAQTKNRVLNLPEYQAAIRVLQERADSYKVKTNEKQIEDKQEDLEK